MHRLRRIDGLMDQVRQEIFKGCVRQMWMHRQKDCEIWRQILDHLPEYMKQCGVKER